MRYPLSLLTLFLVLGCGAAGSSNKKLRSDDIYFKGTKIYEDKLKTLDMNEEDAKRVLEGYLRKESGNANRPVALGVHEVIIGDEFLFSVPDKLGGINLSGYYINGKSREVHEKFSRERLQDDLQRKSGN